MGRHRYKQDLRGKQYIIIEYNHIQQWNGNQYSFWRWRGHKVDV